MHGRAHLSEQEWVTVVNQIIEAHGGTITFDSGEGKGTMFIVTLPRTVE